MIKKTINYEDFNGNKRVEDAYFHLTEVEVIDMAYENESLFNKIEDIAKAQDVKTVIRIVKDIIWRAYGVKSEDGMYFQKYDEDGKRLADKFIQTGAYSALFMELATDDDKCSAFVNGILPRELSESAKKKLEEMKIGKE